MQKWTLRTSTGPLRRADTIFVTRRRAFVPIAVLATVFLVVSGQVGTRAAPAELAAGWSAGASLPDTYSPRWDYSYAYYPPDDEVVLFGGSPRKVSGDSWYNDTWIYNGTGWSKGPNAPPGLTPRGGAALAYLPRIGKLVLFGGSDGSWPPFNQTWLWNGSTWTQGPTAPGGLKGRVGAQMVYMPSLDKLVLFGGSGEQAYRDTWFFDGTAWTPGPSAPAAMLSKTYYGMAYDPILQKVVVAGGDGTRGVWYFSGTAWTKGPDLVSGERERVRMDFDPDLGGTLMFGGMGPGVGHKDLWLLKNGTWTEVLPWSGKPWPDKLRVDGSVLWHPTKDALMLFGGIEANNGGITGWRDTWFFHESVPQVQWVHLDPAGPQMNQAVSLSKGPVVGGYRNWYYEYQWYKNGTLLPNNTDTKLEPAEGDFEPGDVVMAKVRTHDHLNIYGPWIPSPTVTIVNRAPKIQRVTMSPTKGYVGSTLQGNPFGVSEPDGQSYTIHYQWKVNGSVVANNDRATLTPDKTDEGDTVVVSAWVTDAGGMSSPTVVSDPKTIIWNINEVIGAPGNSRTVKGFGFAPNENVDVRLDSQTGTISFTIKAASDGTFTKTGWVVPNLPGSSHMLYGVGKTSGIVGPGLLTISHLAPGPGVQR
jgi:hypothetical protein